MKQTIFTLKVNGQMVHRINLKSKLVRLQVWNANLLLMFWKVFEKAAAAAPSIVYLDDMDKFANADADHCNADEYVAVQSGIDSVKGKDVFVLATTNDLICLPSSLTRQGRFDRTVNVKLPNGEEAEKIIKHYLSGKRLADDICWDDVVMLMFDCTCAELESTLNEALLVSISNREEEVSRESFMEAYFETRIQAPFSDHGETAEAPAEERRRVAVHEAGHAAIYEIMVGRSISLATAFRRFDHRGGLCYCYKPTDCTQERWSEVRVLGALGGRAAIDLVYGVADEGVRDDLERATVYLKNRIGFGVEYGGLYAQDLHRPISSSEMWRQESLLEAALTRHYQRAKQILASNREFLDKLVDAITDNEYLISSDIQAIKETCNIRRFVA